MHKPDIENIIRTCYSAFLSQDMDTLENLLSNDFMFTSPQDDHISREEYFKRCLPASDQFVTLIIKRIFIRDDEAFVNYDAELKDGTKYSNTELYTIADGKIKEVDVYFGPTTHGKGISPVLT